MDWYGTPNNRGYGPQLYEGVMKGHDGSQHSLVQPLTRHTAQQLGDTYTKHEPRG